MLVYHRESPIEQAYKTTNHSAADLLPGLCHSLQRWTMAQLAYNLWEITFFHASIDKYIFIYTYTGWWFQPLWKILANGKDYPIYYGK